MIKKKSPAIEETEEIKKEDTQVKEIESTEEKKQKLEESDKVYKGKFFISELGEIVNIYE